MLKALPYAAILAVLFICQFAVGLYGSAKYESGYNAARLEQSEKTNEQLAKAAQYIINEQAKLQSIEDIIKNDADNSRVKSPVLIRTLKRVQSECSGKTHC